MWQDFITGETITIDGGMNKRMNFIMVTGIGNIMRIKNSNILIFVILILKLNIKY